MQESNSTNPVSQSLESILSAYNTARNNEQFGKEHPIWQEFVRLKQALESHPTILQSSSIKVTWSVGQGNWSRVPWVALLDQRETVTTQRGVYVVFLFREDMSGVYLTFNQGVTDLRKLHGTRESRSILRKRAKQLQKFLSAENSKFSMEGKIDLHTASNLGKEYEYSTVAYLLYEKDNIPPDYVIFQDIETLLHAYEHYMVSDLRKEFWSSSSRQTPLKNEQNLEAANLPAAPTSQMDLDGGLKELVEGIRARGYIYEPWQLAQYVSALRTKPFVILAGITGTGKSKLPQLVAEMTGGKSQLIPVRPDWTDSAEVLGYTDLQGTYRPGGILEVAHAAMDEDHMHWVCILDEMNLARVEHYFAEVLSRIEDRSPAPNGGYFTAALVNAALKEQDAEWGQVCLPSNLSLVGTVNMDESSHGFSRKVLDRAFTMELSEVFLDKWEQGEYQDYITRNSWPVSWWFPRAARLAELKSYSTAEKDRIQQAIDELVNINRILSIAQLQVGYRTRDEIALFLVHAEEISSYFQTHAGEPVDPLDLALQMKILPRIVGGSGGLQRVLTGLLGWSFNGTLLEGEEETRDILEQWEKAERPGQLYGARYPGLASRTCLMWDRLLTEGFTSYWL